MEIREQGSSTCFSATAPEATPLRTVRHLHMAQQVLAGFVLAVALHTFGSPTEAQGLMPTPDADYASLQKFEPTRATQEVVKEIDGKYYKEVIIVQGPLPNLPPAKDLSQFAPTPGYQTFGDCVGWAVAYCSLSTQLRQSRGVGSSSDDIHVHSPRFIYSQINLGSALSGSYIYRSSGTSAVDLVKSSGCSSLRTTPYITASADASGWSRTPDGRAVTEGQNYRAFHHAICETLDDIRYSLVFGVPVVIGCYSEPALQNFQGGGTYEWQGGKDGGHAMCIVGYDNARQAFLIQNSWGTSWGDAGRFWVGYHHFAHISGPSRGTGWCYEAHAIVADSTRGSQLRSTSQPAGAYFFLPDGSIVDQSTSQPIAPLGKFQAVSSTNFFLYGIESNGTVLGRAGQWYNLSAPGYPQGLSGGKATMMASSENYLYVITKAGNVMGRVPKHLSASGQSHWHYVNLPNGQVPVDIRFRDQAVYCESQDGSLYQRQPGTGWTLVN